MNYQDKILKIKQVSEIVGVSASTLRRLERRGEFPRRIRIPGSSRTGWSMQVIADYMEKIKKENSEQRLIHNRTWRS